MTLSVFHRAAEVVSAVSPERTADAVLRDFLRKKPGISRPDARLISQALFAYYRWVKWLDPSQPLEDQISKAVDLTNDFQKNPGGFSDQELARAIPGWVSKELTVTPQWLRSLQGEPTLWLRARREYAEQIPSRLSYARPGTLPCSIYSKGKDDLFRTPEFHEGKFELQDISSQAVSLICAPQPGQTWWDACAGEGGKTLHFSDLMQNKGLIWATDKAEWRLKQLKVRAARAHCFNYRAKLWQDTGKPPTKTLFDGVLLDAPCTGTGTWQRNPHARWTVTENDVLELAQLQKTLLSCAAASVKKEGRLIYAVCTLTQKETAGVADFFDKTHPEFMPCEFDNPFQLQNKQSRLLLWPQDVNGNGMFIAAWKRQSALDY